MDIIPWSAWPAGFDGLVSHGARNYWKSHHLKELSEACLEQIIAFSRELPTAESEVFIPHMEGAPRRVAADEIAFGHCHTPFIWKDWFSSTNVLDHCLLSSYTKRKGTRV